MNGVRLGEEGVASGPVEVKRGDVVGFGRDVVGEGGVFYGGVVVRVGVERGEG